MELITGVTGVAVADGPAASCFRVPAHGRELTEQSASHWPPPGAPKVKLATA